MSTVTTLISLIGSPLAATGQNLIAGNVAWHPLAPEADDLLSWGSALIASAKLASRRNSIYTLIGGDPLGPVVKEWGRRLLGSPNQLELAIGLCAGTPIPDYYVVDSSLTAPATHWYLDNLGTAAPSRILFVEGDSGSLRRHLGRLPYGPPLPDSEALFSSARTYVPLPTPTSGVTMIPSL